MLKKYFVMENRYFDSIVLMEISAKLSKLEGVEDVSVMMGTPGNMDILVDTGFLDGHVEEAGGGDLICCVKMKEDVTQMVRGELEAMLEDTSGGQDESSDYEPRTIEGACELQPGSNIMMLSIPGEHVRWEVKKAIDLGLNVMLFSDNVPVETELELKKLADEKGHIEMGPD